MNNDMSTNTISLSSLPPKRRQEILRRLWEDEKRAGQSLTIEIEQQGEGKWSAEFRRKDGSLAGVA